MMAVEPLNGKRRKRTYTRERDHRDRRFEVFWFRGLLAFHAFACNERDELETESVCGLASIEACDDEPVRTRVDFGRPENGNPAVCELCHRMLRED